MKLNKLFRTFLYACILLAFSVRLQAQTEDVKKLISIEKRRFDAMVHKDTALLKILLADSLTFIHSSGIMDNKISFLKN